MTDDTKEDVQNRLRARFDDDDSKNEGSAQNAGESESSMQTKNEQFAMSSEPSMQSKNPMHTENVKNDWNATSVYLPEFLERQLTRRYKRLDLEYEEEYDRSLQKTRFYYPLVVDAGLEVLAGMDAKELQERIERLEGKTEE